MPNLSLFSVNAVLILDQEGKRVFSKYYSPPHASTDFSSASSTSHSSNPYPSSKDQRTFEKGLVDKIGKQTTDVILYDNRIVVYKQSVDLVFYVVGGLEENELLLYNVVTVIKNTLDILLK
jgi:hypothetical protein